MATDAELTAALDEADEFVLTELSTRTPGARVARQDGVFMAIGAVPSPVIVNTITTSRPGVGIEAIDRAVGVYAAEGKRPSIMTRDHTDAELETALRSSGWTMAIALPGMVVEHRLPEPGLAEGVTLHRVETEVDRERFRTACRAGFAYDDDDREAVDSAFSTLDNLVGGTVAGFYAVLDGVPVACAMSGTDLEAGMGVVGWVGTDRNYRRRGLGSAVTVAATNASFDFGAPIVGLQASPMGLPVYEKLGFRTIAGYKIWFKG